MISSNRTSRSEFWRQLLEEHRQCGLSVKAFCAGKNVSVPSFYQWKHKLQSASAAPIRNPIVPVKLVTVEQTSSVSVCSVQIFTPSGFSVRVDSGMSREALTKLLRAVEDSVQRGELC